MVLTTDPSIIGRNFGHASSLINCERWPGTKRVRSIDGMIGQRELFPALFIVARSGDYSGICETLHDSPRRFHLMFPALGNVCVKRKCRAARKALGRERRGNYDSSKVRNNGLLKWVFENLFFFQGFKKVSRREF